MKQLRLSKGYTALVDDSDYERVAALKWYAEVEPHTVYGARSKCVDGKRRRQALHRFILGVEDPQIDIDHKNGNGLDCRKTNLRPCTRSENLQSRGKHAKRTSTSPFKGVWYSKDRKLWQVGINFPLQKKGKFLGRFENEHKAAVVYDIAARSLFGAFAKTNFQLCPLTIQKGETQ